MSIPGIKKIRNISSLNKVLFKLYSKTYKIEINIPRTATPALPRNDIFFILSAKQYKRLRIIRISIFKKTPRCKPRTEIKNIATDIATPFKPSIKFRKL